MRPLAFTPLFLAACTAAPDSAGVDTGGCAGAAGLTWASYGDVFFRDWCRSCHAVDNPNRFGAPEGVDFDTLDDVRRWKDAIRTSVVDEATMPAGGGLPDAERATLAVYLACRV